MNKRSFFKSLALIAGSASISPQIFIPRFEPVRWKLQKVGPLLIPENPYWYKSEEHRFMFRELYGRWEFHQSTRREYIPWDKAFDEELKHADNPYYNRTTTT